MRAAQVNAILDDQSLAGIVSFGIGSISFSHELLAELVFNGRVLINESPVLKIVTCPGVNSEIFLADELCLGLLFLSAQLPELLLAVLLGEHIMIPKA